MTDLAAIRARIAACKPAWRSEAEPKPVMCAIDPLTRTFVSPEDFGADFHTRWVAYCESVFAAIEDRRALVEMIDKGGQE